MQMFIPFLLLCVGFATSKASLMSEFGCLGDKLALRTYHGKYVVAESNGDVNADRTVANSYETFTVKELGGNKISLKSVHNKYLVAESKSSWCPWCDWEVNANRNSVGEYERFKVEKQDGGKIALKTHHNKYLVAESNNELNGDRTKIGQYEKFTPECKDPVEYRNKCVEACKKTACKSDTDLQNGCNQMYSCAHACKMRHLGVKEDQCRKNCNRNGGSGCSTTINGYQFALCGSCKRGGCSGTPSVAECEIGCASYGKDPINYKWNSWGQWSSCSKTCGGKGTMQRTRTCTPPKWGGNECPSQTQTQTKDCNSDPCPVNCVWNTWQTGECSKTCAGGTRTNTRTKKVTEAHGGTCQGQATLQETCNTQKCPPIHCAWKDWAIGECSKPCGTGTRTNTRKKSVLEANGGSCSGQTTEVEECNTQPCPVDCEWDEWQIGLCSKTCGGGMKTNIRTERLSADHGGEECSGSASVEESCNTQECPVNCEWGSWTLGDCSKTCEGGVRLNVREKTVKEMFGGSCEGNPTLEESCNEQECPVDCKWGEWQIGQCSVTCAGGTRTNIRSKTVEEKYGGVCFGDEVIKETCNTKPCPPIHCEWDEWTIGECSKTCGTGTRLNNRTKVVEEVNGGTCDGQPSEIEECNPEPCPVDCEWDTWQIGECSLTCGGGERINTRSPNITAAHGGEECSGSSSVTESCYTQECPVECVWGKWNTGNCSESCGGGFRINYREKVVEEMFGGTCEGDADMEEDCNTHECPVDCEWHDWQYGECSQTCGGGTRTNTRSKKVDERSGGVCIGDPTEIDECNVQKCPAIHCEWDAWIVGECSHTCGTGTRDNTRTKLVSEEHGGTCTGGPLEVEECNTQECPVDCEWDEWQIGECSEECGGGLRRNTRSAKVESAHGGEGCAGSSSITESCNIQECPVDCQWGDWILGECSVSCGGGQQTNNREKLTIELFGGEPCQGEATEVKECNVDECLKSTCPEENTSCPTYVHYYGRYCEDIPANAWFIGTEGRYKCRKSCGLC